jgi:hypothetical protein
VMWWPTKFNFSKRKNTTNSLYLDAISTVKYFTNLGTIQILRKLVFGLFSPHPPTL